MAAKKKAPPTAAPPTLSLRALNRATLARQMLLAREKTTPLRAIERLVGLQAQWPKPPFIGLWSRVQGFAREDLARLVHDRKVVRATMMRGTLHMMSAGDYLALRPAIQPVLTRGLVSILRARASTFDPDALVAAARAHFTERPRTFTEMRALLMKLHPRDDERAMGFAVRMTLPLVQVPAEESSWSYPADACFAVAEAWLGKPLGAEEPGLRTLVLRYLAAFGPASVADMQAWSGLQGLAAAFEALRGELVVFLDERGKELFDLPKAPRPSADEPAPVRFLPEFDNLIVSRADARFVPTAKRSSVFLPGLRVLATVLVDGVVAATWKVERKKDQAVLVVEAFAPISKKVKEEIAAEGEALARFVEPGAREVDVKLVKA